MCFTTINTSKDIFNYTVNICPFNRFLSHRLAIIHVSHRFRITASSTITKAGQQEAAAFKDELIKMVLDRSKCSTPPRSLQLGHRTLHRERIMGHYIPPYTHTAGSIFQSNPWHRPDGDMYGINHSLVEAGIIAVTKSLYMNFFGEGS